MRWIVAGKAAERGGMSASRMGWSETEPLATDDNLVALADLSSVWIGRVHERKPPKVIVLAMDSFVNPTFGEKEKRPTTAVSPSRAITRCSCSIGSAIWRNARLGPATYTAPITVATYWSRSLYATGTRISGATFGPTRPSPCRRYTTSSNRKASVTPSGFRPTGCCNRESPICSGAPSAGRRRRRERIIRVSSTRSQVGQGPFGSLPKWNGIRADSIPASTSSNGVLVSFEGLGRGWGNG